MIEVTQTRFGFPDQPDVPIGNCFSACVASLLELNLDQVDLSHHPEQNVEWFADRGLYVISFRCDPDKDDIVPPGYHLLGGQSPRRPDRRDMLHCVVARGREIMWDPHPSRAGLLNWQETTIIVPKNIAGWTRYVP